MLAHAEIANADHVECQGAEDLAGLAAGWHDRAPVGRARADSVAGGRRPGDGRDRRCPADPAGPGVEVADAVCPAAPARVDRRPAGRSAASLRRHHAAADLGRLGQATAHGPRDVDGHVARHGPARCQRASGVAGLAAPRDLLAATAQLVHQHGSGVRSQGRRCGRVVSESAGERRRAGRRREAPHPGARAHPRLAAACPRGRR